MTGDSHIISVGVIGAGRMGGVHASNLHSKVVRAKVVAAMDVDQGRAEALADACGAAQIFQDAQELIHSERVEAVLIATPEDTHAGLVLECLRANKPVFCEKPLATTSTDAWQIVVQETALGRKLVQVGFVRRFDNQHLDVKRAFESGNLGRPILFKGWHRYSDVPATSKAILVGAAIHDLDSARWLLGQDIEEVYVRGRNTDQAPSQDTFELLLLQLALSGGCLATIEVYATATYGYEVGVEVVGERGTALIGPPQGPVIRSDQTHAVRIEAGWRERFKEGYLSELEAWISSIKSNSYNGPDAWDGYLSMLAAEGCETALRSGASYRLRPARRPSLYGDDRIQHS